MGAAKWFTKNKDIGCLCLASVCTNKSIVAYQSDKYKMVKHKSTRVDINNSDF